MFEHKLNLGGKMSLKTRTYSELKSYYDQVLNKDKSSFKTSNDEPTPIGCVEEMFEKIPSELWSRTDLKILDPCCGNGNFHLVSYNKLFENGHTHDNIINKVLHFNEINEIRIDNVKDVFGTNVNMTKKDFLTFDTEHKYDLICANPPYAKFTSEGKRASKNHTLVRDFMSMSLKLLKPNGYLVFIVPNNWMSLADRNLLIKEITKFKFLHLDIHGAKKWFPKIGSSFTWMVVQKTSALGDYTVKSNYLKNNYSGVASNGQRDFIPLLWNRHVQSIFSKTIENKNKKFKVETSSDLHKYTKRDLISKTQDHRFKYRLIHTPKQTVWSLKPHKFQSGYKCFISTTDKYKTFVDDCGMTQSIAFIRCKDHFEAQRVKTILEHDLYRFLNNLCRWGNFNNIRILQKFPTPQNEENVYESFKITKDEIKFIETVLNHSKQEKAL